MAISTLNQKSGLLYVVATPIGNLGDWSQRAIDTLKQVDWIACEDTRHSRKLCQHFGIGTPLIALHEHNEQNASPKLMEKLQQGTSGALISDAGTPLVSDPGYVLINAAIAANIPVTPVPGASAAIAALSISGLPANAFQFIGFLPAKSDKRKQVIADHQYVTHTWILYESPHRIMACVQDLLVVLGAERPLVVVRELTKQFEQVFRGTTATVLEQLQQDANHQRGEFVVLIGAHPNPPSEDLSLDVDLALRLLGQELKPKVAAKLVAELSGLSVKACYQRILALNGDANGA